MGATAVNDDEDEMLLGDETEPVSLFPLNTQLILPSDRSISDSGSEQPETSIHRARHMITDPSLHGTMIEDPAESIAAETFRAIKHNMEQHGFDTSHLSPQNYYWILPKPGATHYQLEIFRALRDLPLIVPNGDLGRVVQLELSTENSPPTPPGQHFYILSWELTHDQLKKVIRFMARQDVLLSEVTRWGNTLAIHNDKTQPRTFTIRYVDMVSGPQRPIHRHVKDLATDQRASGVLIEFVAAVEQLFPEVAAAAEMYLVKEASIDGFESSTLAEDTERVLIEYLGHRSLLNRAHGNEYVSFVPLSDDVALFENLHTRYFRGFLNDARSIVVDPQMAAALADHFEEVQACANSHPTHAGTVQHRFTDGVRKAAMRSAEPMLYHGTVILLLLGKDITYEQDLGEREFFKSNVRSAHLVYDILSRLAGTEETNTSPDASWNSKAFNTHHVAFVNFWPWLWHSRILLVDAIRFVQQYLSIIRPLIVGRRNYNPIPWLRIRRKWRFPCSASHQSRLREICRCQPPPNPPQIYGPHVADDPASCRRSSKASP